MEKLWFVCRAKYLGVQGPFSTHTVGNELVGEVPVNREHQE